MVGVAPIPEASQAIAFFLDLSDRQRAEEERARALRAEAEQQTAIANERNRLAAEIHDNLAQQLAAMVMQIGAAEAKLGPAWSEAGKSLTIVRDLAVESLSYARRSVSVLRPGAIAGGLARALRDVVESARRHFEGSIELDVRGGPFLLEAAVEAGLASIAREAITNAVRHSRGTRIDVELAFVRPASAQVVVRDDGIGFDQRAVRPDSFGLRSMRDRAAKAGLALTFVNGLGEGTEVIASWSPIDGDETLG